MQVRKLYQQPLGPLFALWLAVAAGLCGCGPGREHPAPPGFPNMEYMSFELRNNSRAELTEPVVSLGDAKRPFSSMRAGNFQAEAFFPPLVAEEITVSYKRAGNEVVQTKRFPYRSQIPNTEIRHLLIKVVFTDDDVELHLLDNEAD